MSAGNFKNCTKNYYLKSEDKNMFKELLIRMAIPFAPYLKKHPLWIQKIRYRKKYGKRLNIKKPSSFPEKIIWLMLYSDISLWPRLADKYAVREYVKEKCGEECLNDLYGVYDSPEEINYEELPSSFVLKTTNGCATNILVKDKDALDIRLSNNKLKKWMKFPYGELTGQTHYWKIRPRIIAEKYLTPSDGQISLVDYKFFCFEGKPEYVVVYSNREENSHRFEVMVYDMSWKEHPELVNPENRFSSLLPRPVSFERMMDIVRLLSGPFQFVRVDLYEIDGKPVFGEMTFTPSVSGISSEGLEKMSSLIRIKD